MNALANIQLSLEMMPNHFEDLLDSYKQFKAKLNKNQFQVFITHINGTDYADIISAAKELTEQGFTVIPHLAVRNIKSNEKIEQILTDLSSVGVRKLLLLAGDNSQTVHFQSVTEFLDFHKLKQYKFETIFLPTFPEGHPHISNFDDALTELFHKRQIIEEQDIAVNFISQICLNESLLIKHLSRLDSINANIPITVGYIAPIKTTKLIKIASNIGLSNIVSFLSQGKLFQLLKPYDSDQFINQLIAHPKIDALHCYAFGNYTGSFEKMIQYQNQIEQQSLNISNKKGD